MASGGLGFSGSQSTQQTQGGDHFSQVFHAPQINKKSPWEIGLYAVIAIVIATVFIVAFKS